MVALLALCGSLGALAAPTVPPFQTPPELAIFGPEVARAVASALRARGVTGEGEVRGRMEALGDEKVRLVGQVGKRRVQVEGALERVDALATELGERLVPLLASSTTASAQQATAKPAAAKPAKADSATVAMTEPATTSQTTTTTDPATTSQTSTEPAATNETPPAAEPTATSQATTEPATATSPPSEVRPQPIPPPWATPRPVPPSETPFRFRRRGERGRVLLHAVQVQGRCAGLATNAAGTVLMRAAGARALVRGCGIAPLPEALAELATARLPALVMASLEEVGFEREAQGAALRPVGRLRVVVVRDGRAVLVERLDVAGYPMATPDVERAGYDLTAAGFARLSGPLRAVLAGEP